MTIKYHREIQQGTDEWRTLRCGLLTASEMKLVLTPTLKIADNVDSCAHVYDIAAQRVTKNVDPVYETFDMLRGKEDELDARIAYNTVYGAVEDCGFVTNDEWGFTIGFSPDGLIGADGFIESKSRNQKLQFKALVECIALDKMPDEHMLQVQTGFLVTRRKWCDYNTYCGGLFMGTVRAYPDEKVQAAIVEAATNFEASVAAKIAVYDSLFTTGKRMLKTERKNREQDIKL